jgi:hypothetical protein
VAVCELDATELLITRYYTAKAKHLPYICIKDIMLVNNKRWVLRKYCIIKSV